MNADPGRAAMIAFQVNGQPVSVAVSGAKRLADVLREDLGLTGTKIGCNAGDCGACTVLLDGAQVCACLVAAGQLSGRAVITVEGLAGDGRMARLQRAFLDHGAAQCGICTPGMLMAATDLLDRTAAPTRAEARDALGGVLCRCTGYQKIVDAVVAASPDTARAEGAVGDRLARVDGEPKVRGTERFGADAIPADALSLRVLRSPYAAAAFTIGDLDGFIARRSGLIRCFTAEDVPNNAFGIYPDLKDQPVLAEGHVRYRGEAVLAILGEAEAVAAIEPDTVPIAFEQTDAIRTMAAAMDADAPRLHDTSPGNVLVDGRVERGDPASAFDAAVFRTEGRFETAFVEHAYIEPEAGWARRVGDRLEITVSTQTPYMDRDEVASVMALAPDQVRIRPSACGGGFGGKLDQSVQPLVALAAWQGGRPVACVYDRPESMAASTKRHAAVIDARLACDGEGRLVAAAMDALFDTGAYASWGPTVAGRVPVHAAGPYRVGAHRHRGRAIYTNNPPAGAFRGFGVPQAAIAHECLIDDLALATGIDRLAFRARSALRAGDITATGQRLDASVGLGACLDALRQRWDDAVVACANFNRTAGERRRGVGIGCMWYGIGNTALSNPSTMRVGLAESGRITLFNGAVDIGQGANTVMAQICAEALGLPVHCLDLVCGDTDRTADAGKTSASRQTFVSGRAAQIAGETLRAAILREANAGSEARLGLQDGRVLVEERGRTSVLDPKRLDRDGDGFVLWGEGCFDPPTSPLDADGQGAPYATYAFAAQMAVVEVDTALAKVRPLAMVAAHDVGRAINPTLVEGQIEGGIAQGLGLALMEEYLPGRTENLHDYLIPTIGDMPDIEVILIEDREPLGPFGAKGVGEPGLVPTAPAILGAIRDATGVRCTEVPVLPHRLHAWMKGAGRS